MEDRVRHLDSLSLWIFFESPLVEKVAFPQVGDNKALGFSKVR